jgi:hypothetical protein
MHRKFDQSVPMVSGKFYQLCNFVTSLGGNYMSIIILNRSMHTNENSGK